MPIQKIKGRDYVEAKEAFTDSLINLTYQLVSGEGSDGDFVYGEKPFRKFVSGFLLPALNESGTDDETNDIHISNIGMDFQVNNPPTGKFQVHVAFSIYIRVLPSWSEIIRYQLWPNFQLRTAIQKQIKHSIRDRLSALILEEQNKPQDQQRGRLLLRVIANEEINRQFGIVSNENPLELDDDHEESEDTGVEGDNPRESITYNKSTILPDNLAQPQDIPLKWRRFSFSSEKMDVNLESSKAELEAQLINFENKLWFDIKEKISSWVASLDGLQWAYREIPVYPSQIANSDAWSIFLEAARHNLPDLGTLLPTFNRLRIVISKTPNYSDSSVTNIRVSFENQNNAPLKSRYKSHDSSIHQVHVAVSLPEKIHSPLRLERIEPSFRFRNFMTYPALGINCGIEHQKEEPGNIVIKTTWLPKYILPRISSRELNGIPWKYDELANFNTDLTNLYKITDEYMKWIDEQGHLNPADYVLDPVKHHEELEEYRNAIDSFNKECMLIRRGIDLLKQSQLAFKRDPDSGSAIPYHAWILLNKSMNRAGQEKGIQGWRLFQEAFILAHIPSISSRIDEFRSCFNYEVDEETASLLYFPTGGGKSEAFYGLLIFNLFFDRLRGKHRGITALIRYPLRLLTLQQAQRLFELLACAEVVKHEEGISGASFEIGFWVGNANTPNRNTSDEIRGILKIDDEIPEEGTPERAAHDHANNAFNKIPTCPYCGRGPTSLRYYPNNDNRVGILCFYEDCKWNRMNHGITPLPFILTDQDIYAQAPAIILGTIDKLALIGQHHSTISKIVGMLGLARFVDPQGRLSIPRKRKELREALENPALSRIAPAFADGVDLFLDPFPSLIIQDEAHLLEESLGTFAGLFETAFEELLNGIAPLLGDRISRDDTGKPRLPKIVAATATISSPGKHIESLYQRRYLQFPYPGTSIYESFYSHPEKSSNPMRQAVIASASKTSKEKMAETYAPWMRIYTSIMTNGRLHTVTTVHVLAAFHVTISKLWKIIQSDSAMAVSLVKNSLSESPIKIFHAAAIELLRDDPETLLGILDLFRISLVYVTNKKGGDQIIDALNSEAPKLYTFAGLPNSYIRTELISGGVDVKTIQNVMRMANETITEEDFEASLRNIVATSAISHGVDVDKFNAMFFAGVPTDISEYIQASSRVGRAHVGFSLLIPIPQKRRDRYIVEVHDIFHRFLERMIAPAAIERWADNALKRVIPSLFQSWLIGCQEQELFVHAYDKLAVAPINDTHEIKKLIQEMTFNGFFAKAADFVLKAIGVNGRGTHLIGKPNNQDYYESSILNEIHKLITEFNERSDTVTELDKFWTGSRVAKRPMTSLRDIDEAGVIMAGKYLPERIQKGILRIPRIEGAMLIATKNVRKQTAAYSEMESEGES